MSFTSRNAEAIRRLSPDAVIFSFAHQGALPGPMTVEAPVSRADGSYPLYRYNAITGKAEAAGTVAVKNGAAVFTVTQGSDFFFGEAASASPDTGGASPLPGGRDAGPGRRGAAVRRAPETVIRIGPRP